MGVSPDFLPKLLKPRVQGPRLLGARDSARIHVEQAARMCQAFHGCAMHSPFSAVLCVIPEYQDGRGHWVFICNSLLYFNAYFYVVL